MGSSGDKLTTTLIYVAIGVAAILLLVVVLVALRCSQEHEPLKSYEEILGNTCLCRRETNEECHVHYRAKPWRRFTARESLWDSKGLRRWSAFDSQGRPVDAPEQ